METVRKTEDFYYTFYREVKRGMSILFNRRTERVYFTIKAWSMKQAFESYSHRGFIEATTRIVLVSSDDLLVSNDHYYKMGRADFFQDRVEIIKEKK